MGATALEGPLALDTPSILRMAVAVASSVSEVLLRLDFLSHSLPLLTLVLVEAEEEEVEPADDVNEVAGLLLLSVDISATTCRMEPDVILHSI